MMFIKIIFSLIKLKKFSRHTSGKSKCPNLQRAIAIRLNNSIFKKMNNKPFYLNKLEAQGSLAVEIPC